MIRVARQADIPAITELMHSEPGFWDAAWRPDTLALAIRAADDLAVVWEENNAILAFGCAQDCGFRSYLSALIVHPTARHRGIGRRIVEEIEERLATRRCSVLISDVWQDSVGFYRSLGWSPPDVVLLRQRLDR